MLEEIQSNEKYASQNVDTYQYTYHSTNLHHRIQQICTSLFV